MATWRVRDQEASELDDDKAHQNECDEWGNFAQANDDVALENDRRRWESFSEPVQARENRPRMKQWAINQGCDTRSILVFLSLQPQDREWVRDFG